MSRLRPKIDFSRMSPEVSKRFDSEARIHVACSGGADSVFALLLVYLYLENKDCLQKLRVLHFDHALRGEESRADAVFVKELAAALSIPFLEARAEWSASGSRISEATARAARLDFFANASEASTVSPAYIATGHHADDVVETVLMRLSRGAGIQGLGAPRAFSDAGKGLVFLRPILDWSREEIRTLLEGADIPWREDSTNASDGNYRARLRKAAVPEWEKAADRPIRPGVCRSRRLLEQDAEALDAWANSLFAEHWSEEENAYPRAAIQQLPVAMQRRLLARMPGAESIVASLMEEILTTLDAGSDAVFEVRRNLFIRLCRERIQLFRSDCAASKDWKAFVLPLGAVAYLPGGERLSIAKVEIEASFAENLGSSGNDDAKSVYLKATGNSEAGLIVRPRQPGDAFKPLGKSSPKKLKDLFIERKIDRTRRDQLPVFTNQENEILWVPGIPPSDAAKLAFGSQAALRLTYER